MAKWYHFSIEATTIGLVLIGIIYIGISIVITGGLPQCEVNLNIPITLLAVGGGVGSVKGLFNQILRAIGKRLK